MKTPAKRDRILSHAVAEAFEPRRLMSGIGYTLSDVALFSNSGGYQSNAGLVRDGSGNLYGTTKLGGTNNLGTVFKVANGSSAIATVASFNSSSGSYPTADLVMDGSGNLYGTTPYGGANGLGTVFEVAAGASKVTPLASFTSAANDVASVKLMVDSSGNLYGTTPFGGANSSGSVFKIVAGGGTITTLASFNTTTGDDPSSGLVVDGAGNLYGVTRGAGANGFGSIYKLASGASSVTVLAAFTAVNGYLQASAPIIDSHGNLFGTTQFGGANGDGSVYQLSSGSSTISTLASFNGSNGANPSAPLLLDSSGDLFGTTAAGGGSNDGTIFEVTAGSNAITTLAAFTGTNGYPGTDGFSGNPIMPDLVSDTHGDYYGVVPSGTTGNLGAVYELAPQKASQVVVTQQPVSAVTAGTTQTISVSMETANGAVDTTNSASVTISISAGPAGAVLGGTLSAQASSGVANFSTLVFKIAGSYTLSAGSTGLSSGFTTSITVVAGSATKLAIAQQPTGAAVGQAIGSIIADVVDAFGNTVATDTSTVTLSTAAGTVLSGTTATPALAGVATFSGISIGKAGTYTLSLTDTGLTSANTSSFVITAGAASQLVVVHQPAASTVAGQSFGAVIVDVEDSFGNLLAANSSTVAAATGNNVAIAGTKSKAAVGGVANLSGLSISTAGTYTLTITDGNLAPATTTSFVVTAAAASKLIVMQQPATPVAVGQTIAPVIVDVEDSFGNLVSGSSATVKVATTNSTPISGTISAQASGGVATFNAMSMNKAGSYTLSLTSTGLTSVNTNSFVVTAAAASELVITQQPGSTTMAGQPIGALIVSVADAFGNIVSADTSTMTVAESSGTPLSGTLSRPAVGGSATFGDLSITTAGTYTFTISDGSLTSVISNTFTITPAAASQLVMSTPPTTVVAGQPMSALVVEAVDMYGNLATADQSSVTITASSLDGTSNFNLSGTTTVAVQNGLATFSDLSIDTAGSYTLTATDAALNPATSGTVVVTAAPTPPPGPGPVPVTPTPPLPSHVVIAGNALAKVIINARTTFAGAGSGLKFVSVKVQSADGSAVLTDRVRVIHGRVRIDNLRIHKAGVYTLIIADAEGETITEQFTVIAAKPAKLQFVTMPTTVNGTSPVVVGVTDRYGNPTSAADRKVVTLHLGSHAQLGHRPVLTGTTTALLIGGIATFPDVSINRPGLGRLLASAPGLRGLMSVLFLNR